MFRQLRYTIGPVLVITRREVRDQFRDWRIIFPILLLTVFFPALMNFTAERVLHFVEDFGASVVGERLIPFLLMIVGFFPVSVSLVIALESFVGEKERHSIEPLLSTPLSDWQLYLGKLLAAILMPLIASYLGITVYLVGVYRELGWLPDPELLAQILLLTTVQAILMVSGAVVISSQTTSVRAANLLASFIIIPMALMIQGESVVMFWGRYHILWWVIAGLVVISGLLTRAGVAHFSREELLGQELDSLNLRWGWQVFIYKFRSGTHSLLGWYRQVLSMVSREMLIPSVLAALALVIGVWIGTTQAKVFILPTEMLQMDSFEGSLFQGPDVIRFFSVTGVGSVWFHNIRAIILASLLGLFSFGVLGMIILMLPLALVGYFMASLTSVGLSPALFFGSFILPHGILEIPAIILAGGAILRLGGTLATPSQGRSIGEALLNALADWFRVMLGLVVPLLLGAAILEVYLTPRIVALLLGG
jgi:uncharacterized membrane protein SpoIIM required for sporulation/ABC-type transport system involved in multi-copper enzyme maturation permease subunit